MEQSGFEVVPCIAPHVPSTLGLFPLLSFRA